MPRASGPATHAAGARCPGHAAKRARTPQRRRGCSQSLASGDGPGPPAADSLPVSRRQRGRLCGPPALGSGQADRRPPLHLPSTSCAQPRKPPPSGPLRGVVWAHTQDNAHGTAAPYPQRVPRLRRVQPSAGRTCRAQVPCGGRAAREWSVAHAEARLRHVGGASQLVSPIAITSCSPPRLTHPAPRGRPRPCLRTGPVRPSSHPPGVGQRVDVTTPGSRHDRHGDADDARGEPDGDAAPRSDRPSRRSVTAAPGAICLYLSKQHGARHQRRVAARQPEMMMVERSARGGADVHRSHRRIHTYKVGAAAAAEG
eukprot:scaffold2911_cov414-Prasinococcus_capsulatus_cf.AAC.14